MTTTSISTGGTLASQQYMDKVFMEYVDKLVFGGFMGTTSDKPIFVIEDLAKGKGEAVTAPLAAQIDGAGVSGESTLEGSEEQMSLYGQKVTLTEYSNAIRDSGALTRKRAAFDLFDLFKPQLTTWLAQKTETLIMDAMADIAGTAYASAGESARDTWLAANTDRVLFGAATSNNAANDHSACLAEVDSSSDMLQTTQISLAKRLAQLADPKIRPVKLENGLEFYVMFAHPYCVRDLKKETVFQNAQRDAMPRGMDNPLFTGAVGYWDGVLIVESDKVTIDSGVGASSIDVAKNVLCGAQAVLLAQGAYDGGMRVKMVEKEFDYDRQKGCAIMSMFKVAKGYFNSKDHGIVSVYSAAVAD